MRKIIKRSLTALTLVLVLGTTAFAVAVKVREDRTFEAPYPDLHATADASTIERGRYLATGPAHCVSCHATPGVSGEQLAGGLEFDLPVGKFYARNITPDIKTGIGRYTDPEIARLLRYGVHPTGRAMLPFMPFSDLSDEDLVAVISYLRSQPPIDHAVPDHAPNTLGRIAKAFVLEPRGPTQPIRARVAVEPTAQYGEYLAKTVANCSGCHTRRSLKTGEATGVELAGGMELDSHAAPGTKFTTPNLTPDPKTGRITAWSEEQFIARFKNGTDTASPMPWGTFRNMTDDDLRALYRYLRTLPPATVGQDL